METQDILKQLESMEKRVAKEAVKEYVQHEREKQRKKSLYNTGLLMANYLDFVDVFNEIKYKATDISDVLPDIEDIDINDISIKAIKRCKYRTAIIISQIETALDMLKADCKITTYTHNYVTTDSMHKYKVVEMLYTDKEKKGLPFGEKICLISEELGFSEKSIRKWNNEMLNKLSIKLFGVDGLRLDL